MRWVPARSDIIGNEMADRYAKEAAQSTRHSVTERLVREASLSHLAQVVTERRLSTATNQWITDHIRPERRYRPPTGAGLRRKALRKVGKSLASRYYQLLSGYAAIGSFLNERMTGPLR